MSNKIGVSIKFCLTFIQNARFRRTTELSLLREENLALLNIINDFDTRLATVEAERDVIADTCKRTHELCVKWQEETRKVEAERDALQRKLDGYHHMARNTRIVDIRELDLAAHKVIL